MFPDVTILAAVILSLLTVGLHYELLVFISFVVQRVSGSARFGVALAVVMALIAHMIEVAVFAAGWHVLIQWGYVELAHFEMEVFVPTFIDALYFSGSVYTSLGFGDIVPASGGQVLAVSEAVTGLVLIAWTASYTFFHMQSHWREVRGGGSR